METIAYEFYRKIPVVAETEVLIAGGYFSGIIDAAA